MEAALSPALPGPAPHVSPEMSGEAVEKWEGLTLTYLPTGRCKICP